MSDRFLLSTSANVPSLGLSDPMQALWWLAKGDWQMGAGWDAAHDICQRDEGDHDHDWVHALVHLIEGDAVNAAYWYKRCGEVQVSNDPRKEWDNIVAALT